MHRSEQRQEEEEKLEQSESESENERAQAKWLPLELKHIVGEDGAGQSATCKCCRANLTTRQQHSPQVK